MSIEFQRQAVKQGQQWEQVALAWVKHHGYKVLAHRAIVAEGYPTVDIVTAHGETNREVWFEVKGSFHQKTPGLLNNTTVKALIAVAADLCELRMERSPDGDTAVPYIVLTSHLPSTPVPKGMLDRAISRGWITEVKVLFEE